jgi:hypothetical protein
MFSPPGTPVVTSLEGSFAGSSHMGFPVCPGYERCPRWKHVIRKLHVASGVFCGFLGSPSSASVGTVSPKASARKICIERVNVGWVGFVRNRFEGDSTVAFPILSKSYS